MHGPVALVLGGCAALHGLHHRVLPRAEAGPPTRGLETQGDPFEPVKIGVLVDMDLGQLLADWIDPTILAIEDADARRIHDEIACRVYGAAVDAVLDDQQLDPEEEEFLSRLRRDLEISADVAQALLDEGIHFVSQVLDCPPDALRPGLPVDAVFVPVTDAVTLVKFRRRPA